MFQENFNLPNRVEPVRCTRKRCSGCCRCFHGSGGNGSGGHGCRCHGSCCHGCRCRYFLFKMTTLLIKPTRLIKELIN